MNYEITGKTKLTALIGSPVAHSISPQMHNEAYHQLGLDYVYLAFDIEQNQLQDTIFGFKAMEVAGFNVTMPFKTAVIPFLDELSPQARLSNAVNTVVHRENRLFGHTTDGIGYINALKADGVFIRGNKMTLLGAGGAAFSICVQAAFDGASSIDMFKRKPAHTDDKKDSWAETLDFCKRTEMETGCPIHLYDINDKAKLKASLLESRILTNATNAGMAPDINSCVIDDITFLHKDLFVSDIIYNPKETLLLKMAKKAGCSCQNGLNMLLYQGAEAFRLFTGREMPTKLIKQKYFK